MASECIYWADGHIVFVLILVLVEDGFRDYQRPKICTFHASVLILVLVEDGFRDIAFDLIVVDDES